MRAISLFSLFSLALLAACEGPSIGETDDPDTDTEADTSATCTATLASTNPPNGAAAQPIDRPLTATFSSAVLAGDIQMGVSGVQGTTSLSTDGLTATWTPNSDLQVNTDYTLTVSVCGASTNATFRTAGLPLANTDLDGRTYVIDYADVQWIAPPGADLIAGDAPVEFILVHVADVDVAAPTIELVGSLGETNEGGGIDQDPCRAPFAFGAQSFDRNPQFEVGPTTLSFNAGNFDVNVEQAYISAVFVEDGDALSDIVIRGELDSRPFDSQSFSGDMCTDLQFVGATCTACTSDGAIECLDVELNVARADADATISFDPDLVPGLECQ